MADLEEQKAPHDYSNVYADIKEGKMTIEDMLRWHEEDLEWIHNGGDSE